MIKNKKADILMTMLAIMIWIMVFFAIFIFIIRLQDEKEKLVDLCKKECNRFDYNFYKIENPGFLQSYQCWCLDDNKPKNIGNLN